MANVSTKEVTTADVVKEAAEVAAVTVGAGMVTGALDYKKVAIVAGGVVLTVGAVYLGKKFYDKRKAAKLETVEVATEGKDAEVPEEKKTTKK